MLFQINDMRLKARLASAAAAMAITSMMLISVGLGFPRLAAASERSADVVVKVPSTVQAAKARELIDRASRAFLARVSGERISELWVFPTGDANAVFVCYTTINEAVPASVKSGAGETRHIALLEMQGEQIASLHDFAAPSVTLAADAATPKSESGS